MKYTDNSLNILTVKAFKGIGNAWVVKNLKGYESVEKIVELLNSKIGSKVTMEEFEKLKNDFKTVILKKFEGCCDGVVAFGDDNFPAHRGNVKDGDCPVFLYYKGNLDLLSQENKNISVIGLLNPDAQIESREKRMVSELVKRGAVIVSGLAFGCDSISHLQTLESNGRTVAILPSPLFNILPARNKSLANKIVEEGGLLVSEYGNDFKNTMELSSRYKERDRLQALYCDTIVLAASYAQYSAQRWGMLGQKLDSGARLAMGYAKEYGIPRAVMYDVDLDFQNPMFDLNRDLITDDKSVIIIDQSSLIEKVEQLLNNHKSKKDIIQKGLFE